MDLTQYTIWAPTLMLVAVRAAGIFILAPAMGNAAIPAKLRYMFSVVLALGVVGRLAEPAAVSQSWPGLLLAVACEAMIGLTIGYVARLVFVGIELGAAHISQQMGITLVAAMGAGRADPVRRLMYLLAVVIFLTIGGHRQVLSGLMSSFETVPLMGFAPGKAMLEMVTAVLAASFVLAIKVAAPVVITLLLTTVVMALLGRSMPQFNMLWVELPVRAMVGLLVLAAALASLPGLIEGAAAVITKHVSVVFGAGT
jgi:flagellar biosynthetic protein FliR